jgi:hypothetical protein
MKGSLLSAQRSSRPHRVTRQVPPNSSLANAHTGSLCSLLDSEVLPTRFPRVPSSDAHMVLHYIRPRPADPTDICITSCASCALAFRCSPGPPASARVSMLYMILRSCPLGPHSLNVCDSPRSHRRRRPGGPPPLSTTARARHPTSSSRTRACNPDCLSRNHRTCTYPGAICAGLACPRRTRAC